jgi:hypothetical protein
MLNNHVGTFALVEIHGGDAYATTWGNSRMSYYALAGYPTAWFDCKLKDEGAYTDDTAQYNWYNDTYNPRRAVTTDVTLQLGARHLTGQTYRIYVLAGLEAGGSGKTVRVQTTQVLDHWPASPTYSRNGFKQAATYQGVSLTAGGFGLVKRDFTFDADSWAHQSNIKIVAWAQRPGTAPPTNTEAWQAAEMKWPFPLLWKTGDMNCDGAFDGADLDPFFLALGDPTAYATAYPICDTLNGDANGDGTLDAADIDPFFDLLGGGG